MMSVLGAGTSFMVSVVFSRVRVAWLVLDDTLSVSDRVGPPRDLWRSSGGP